MPSIERPSVASLLLGLVHGEDRLSTATGFVVEHQGVVYLVTNRHVVTGRDQNTGSLLDKDGATPQFVDISHNRQGQTGVVAVKRERLYDANIDPLWLEHPVWGPGIDVVALPLTDLAQVDLYPYDPWQVSSDVMIGVTTELSIVGFPYGETVGASLAIWSRGSIASEPVVDLDSKPRFLIDSRTRPGQSGSPVLYHNSSGSVRMASGGVNIVGTVTKFLGVYSGRLNRDSDLGYVWKATVVQDVVTGGRKGVFPHFGT